tara:strand:+ start:9639 stop:10025 length:387 start_codon:yes stop_codon:yes gene_type:complete
MNYNSLILELANTTGIDQSILVDDLQGHEVVNYNGDLKFYGKMQLTDNAYFKSYQHKINESKAWQSIVLEFKSTEALEKVLKEIFEKDLDTFNYLDELPLQLIVSEGLSVALIYNDNGFKMDVTKQIL